jgi:hypothetical protein
MVQGEGPEFKPQYQRGEKKKVEDLDLPGVGGLCL